MRQVASEAVFALYLAEDKIEPEVVENMPSWEHSGSSVDQSVLLAAGDQAGIERLVQYITEESHATVDAEQESLSRSSQSWAMLIKRVYELDPLTCPECGGQMAVVAFVEPPQTEVIEKILCHCGLWRSPAARAPPANASGDAIDRPCRSDSAPDELTYVDMDTFLATF